jgi:hypothetical protein
MTDSKVKKISSQIITPFSNNKKKELLKRNLTEFYAVEFKPRSKEPLSRWCEKRQAFKVYSFEQEKIRQDFKKHLERSNENLTIFQRLKDFQSKNKNAGIMTGAINRGFGIDIDTKDGINWKFKLNRLIDCGVVPETYNELVINRSSIPDGDDIYSDSGGAHVKSFRRFLAILVAQVGRFLRLNLPVRAANLAQSFAPTVASPALDAGGGAIFIIRSEEVNLLVCHNINIMHT